jgi:hypothetical protein
MSWPAEKVEKAVALARQGLSGRQIAEALGGVTPGAVIACLARLRRKGDVIAAPKQCKASVVAPKKFKSKQGASVLAPIKNLPAQANETMGGTGDDCGVVNRGAWPPQDGASSSRGNDSLSVVTGGESATPPSKRGPVPLLKLQAGQCRWPLWSDNDRPPIEQRLFCGLPSGRSYCAEHAERCYGGGTPSERRAHEVAGVRLGYEVVA